MERAWFAENTSIMVDNFIQFFNPKSNYHMHCSAASHTRWLTGENPQSVRVVDPLDLHSAITEDGQENMRTMREMSKNDSTFEWISQIKPVFRESVQQVICLEYSWEVVDLDDMTKLLQIDVSAQVDKEVVLNMLNGNIRGVFQVHLNLTGQSQ